MTLHRCRPLLSKPEKNKIFYMKCYRFLWLGLYFTVLEVRAINTIFRSFVAKTRMKSEIERAEKRVQVEVCNTIIHSS